MILEIPWEESKYLRLKYKNVLTTYKNGLYLYKGTTSSLPADLKPYITKDYSYARWLENEARIAKKLPLLPNNKSKTIFKPRDYQLEDAKKIYQCYIKGWSGFLIASSTGTGKTLSTLTGITATAQKNGFTSENRAKVLIVCPKSVIPVWRQTINSFPTAEKILQPLIINYQQLGKLITTDKPVKGKTRKTKSKNVARTGSPTVNWDFIIFDESHYLKNYPSSTMSLNATTIAQLNKPYIKGETPYVVFSTATPGASPLNMALMSNFISKLLNSKITKDITPAQWGEFLLNEGFAITKGKTGYNWALLPWYGKNSENAGERLKYLAAEKKNKTIQRRDSLKIGKALTSSNAPFIRRMPTDIAGWPEQQLIPLPIELTAKQQPIYEEAWSRFRKWLKLTPAKHDPKGQLVENLRYRQKSSLLKVESMIEYVKDFIENDKQIYISIEFIETIDEYKKYLDKLNIPYVELSGRNVKEREPERIRFQKGKAKVALCTIVEGISLHAKEDLPDGTKASSNERITIIHDVRNNPEKADQSLGRAHRSGENSLTYIPYFENTVDETVINSYVNKQANMKGMTGSRKEDIDMFEDIFRRAAE